MTAIHRMVEACRTGRDPSVIARMPSGWAVMGQRQVLPGYCLLLPDPVVPSLNALPPVARDQFMTDLGRLGDAVLAVTRALRINYAMFGNVEPALHAHVHPRFVDEPEAMRTANPWGYDWSQAPQFDEVAHGPLRDAIRNHLQAEAVARTAGDGAPGRIHHIDITVSDITRSTAFYDRCLTLMGFARIADCDEGPLWRGEHLEIGLQQARNAGVVHDRYSPGLHHLAFAAPDRAAVNRLHERLCEQNVSILDAPADYANYAPGYFAVFFSDPDGIKLEYVFTSPV
jgi:catechol 2,3-dioxygenase-like lactoylglutathione lyase family enzyme/diadenosine tetraphosphate (Ap4A) HIT family hydrolase